MSEQNGNDLLILAMDSSGASCSAAVMQNDVILAELILDNGKTHARSLVGICEGVMREAGVGYKDLSAFACVNGPGSFTGLRIGVSTCKGMAYAVDKPIVAVSSLAALAESFQAFPGILVAAQLDARGGRCFAQLYYEGRAMTEALPTYYTDQVTAMIDLKNKLNYTAVAFCGSGARHMESVAAQQALANRLGVPCLAMADARISAAAVAVAAGRRIRSAQAAAEGSERVLLTPAELTANYLVVSQAERLRRQATP